jgi:hypothetical protein
MAGEVAGAAASKGARPVVGIAGVGAGIGFDCSGATTCGLGAAGALSGLGAWAKVDEATNAIAPISTARLSSLPKIAWRIEETGFKTTGMGVLRTFDRRLRRLQHGGSSQMTCRRLPQSSRLQLPDNKHDLKWQLINLEDLDQIHVRTLAAPVFNPN